MARLVVAVTGGIASGKSLVDRTFSELGVPVVDADVIAREIVQPGQPALEQIAEAFGPSVLRADGTLNRVAMRALVFADPGQRRVLERITHPTIRKLMFERCNATVAAYVVASIPLLAEVGAREAYEWLGRIIVVDAPADQQRARLMARDSIEGRLADEILASQVGRIERMAIASDVINNDSSPEHARAAVRALDRLFRTIASA
jgi:dephospho-CoA kinase